MNSSIPAIDAALLADPALADAVEELTARLKAGEPVDLEAWLAARPEQASELRRLFPMLRTLVELSRSGDVSVPPVPGEDGVTGTLGDFRIIRQVGHGGMGIVYEAEQISLGRRVALKVLPFAATMDPRQLQRFQNEARAAASLDHPHIVHVHAVGCERAVHFYAMQFIDGQTLAAIIADLRRAGGGPIPTEEQPTAPHVPDQPAPAADTSPRAATSTERAPRDRTHFRRVAEWGIQAAEALDHAHQLGIVHRDIKPANLMVDGRGNLYVTDFGLAHIQSEAGLTMTGDLVGTLRYMSPEQALAKRVVIDHRTDVYSLGATLYELLMMKPAFPGNDRQELLRRIAFEEPEPPRRVNKAIPAELETIVLKAMEKNPADRYTTAKELADDLRCWLEDKPIRARPPSLSQRAGKWARRHRPVAAAGAATLLLAVLMLAISNFVIWRKHLTEVEALRKADRFQKEVNAQVVGFADLRNRSEARLEIALRGMDRFLGEAEKEGPLSPSVAEGAVQFYEGFLPLDFDAGRSWLEINRPSLCWEAAWANVHLGNLYALLDRFEKAKEAYSLASRYFSGFASMPPGNGEAERLVSQDRPAVEEEFRRALAHWKRAAPEGLGTFQDYHADLAQCLQLLALAPTKGHPALPHHPLPDSVYRKSIELLEQGRANHPSIITLSSLIALYHEYADSLWGTRQGAKLVFEGDPPGRPGHFTSVPWRPQRGKGSTILPVSITRRSSSSCGTSRLSPTCFGDFTPPRRS